MFKRARGLIGHRERHARDVRIMCNALPDGQILILAPKFLDVRNLDLSWPLQQSQEVFEPQYGETLPPSRDRSVYKAHATVISGFVSKVGIRVCLVSICVSVPSYGYGAMNQKAFDHLLYCYCREMYIYQGFPPIFIFECPIALPMYSWSGGDPRVSEKQQMKHDGPDDQSTKFLFNMPMNSNVHPHLILLFSFKAVFKARPKWVQIL